VKVKQVMRDAAIHRARTGHVRVCLDHSRQYVERHGADRTVRVPGTVMARLSKSAIQLLVGMATFLAIAGCAPLYRDLPAEKKIQSVALVVALPESLYLLHTGLLSVTKEDVEVDWQLNDRLRARLGAILARRYTVVATDIAPNVLLGSLSLTEIMTGTDTSVRLKELLKPGLADVIVVAHAETGKNSGGGAYVEVVKGVPYVGLRYWLGVFDGATFAPLASRGSSVKAPSYRVTSYDFPRRVVDVGYRGQPYLALPDQTKEYVRRLILGLIDETAVVTLATSISPTRSDRIAAAACPGKADEPRQQGNTVMVYLMVAQPLAAPQLRSPQPPSPRPSLFSS
jgi:hypothetical protein